MLARRTRWKAFKWLLILDKHIFAVFGSPNPYILGGEHADDAVLEFPDGATVEIFEAHLRKWSYTCLEYTHALLAVPSSAPP
jgi:hypothetical protein